MHYFTAQVHTIYMISQMEKEKRATGSRQVVVVGKPEKLLTCNTIPFVTSKPI